MESATLTYCALGLCLTFFVGSFFFASPKAPAWLQKLAKFSSLVQLAALLGAYAVLRPGASSDFTQLEAKATQEHKLLLLSFHSNN